MLVDFCPDDCYEPVYIHLSPARIQTHTDCMPSTVVKKRIHIALPCVGGLFAADYTGNVNSDGVPHGRGSWEVVEGVHKGYTYEGTFLDGKCDGFGKDSWAGGVVYLGEWKAHMGNGFAKVDECLSAILNVTVDHAWWCLVRRSA
jgi:hypothetical protein